ncbi:CG7059 [Drosophila busckii]|uniref:Phosphoglycerate mutase n=2 Tax=Drosophila busckii TaxID=30019 RepID=A0A0M3QYG5_DROBS|nr:2,3-bisphosphoglycerate-dependent phosphoglycerate mutase isoform X2 [Drosophila busckii]ALC47579.1 CG7059 [Drosophila busckii]
MKTNRLIIIRHGESEFNLKNLFCGWHDAPLTQKGVHNACSITAAALIKARLEIDKVYCSALYRARHTAEMVLCEMKCANVPVVVDWRLCERHYGNLTGFNKREMADRYGEQLVQTWRRGYHAVPPAITVDNPYYYEICNNLIFSEVPAGKFPLSESMAMCVERIKPALEEIKQDVLKGTRVLICTHGTVVRALVNQLEGLSEAEVEKINIVNSVPIVYEFNMQTGERIGSMTYLGDPEYIRKKTAQVASLGERSSEKS